MNNEELIQIIERLQGKVEQLERRTLRSRLSRLGAVARRRRGLVAAIATVLVAAVATLCVYAATINDVPNEFTAGTPISAAAMNANFDTLVANDQALNTQHGGIVSSQWSAATGGINYAGGNVGVGTTAPGEKIQIAGGRVYSSGTGSSTGFLLDNWNLYQAPTTNAFNIGYNGTPSIAVLPSGNVGIGTNDPHGKLDVSGGRIELSTSDVTNPMMAGYQVGLNAYSLLGYLSATNGGLYLVGMSDSDATGGLYNGCIGVADPTDSTPALIISGSKYNGSLADTAMGASETVVQIKNWVNPMMTFLGSGYVGIGTTNPLYKLDVQGDARVTGNILYGGGDGTPGQNIYTKNDYVFEDDYRIMETMDVEQYIIEHGHLPWVTSAKEEGDTINMTRMGFETLEALENLQLQVIRLAKENRELRERLEVLESGRP